ncbi:hypothetical protein P154DRAFT_553572 [Amniculicola lignicola CBS 123094]|uniref:HTH CENPB-type domain-containing protein n=1 Tax=Amniculicola lignicola CBS 123094 TaxID=1392246 RepID=A0A6A5WVE3_9PLEO|nr:hypothetical protein P154DRAFT_553572 [Amniculicola lignicola CBS 123094]
MDPIQDAVTFFESQELGEELSHQGVQTTRAAAKVNKQKLSHEQEIELVEYIEGLTQRALPPTRAMIRNFASYIARERVGEGWTTGMDRKRHHADSEAKYNLYFDLLYQKIAQYRVEPQHTYNMDKKGFLISITGRSKRIFSKQIKALPLGLIYQAAQGNVQSTWVEAIEAGKH